MRKQNKLRSFHDR